MQYLVHIRHLSMLLKYSRPGISLVVHWLRLWASNGEGMGSIPSLEMKIIHTMQWDQKKKKKNTDFQA